MNKRELIVHTAETSGLTKVVVQQALDAIIRSCLDALKQGQDISIVGFGSFKVKDKQGRIGRNPKTGEKLTIAPSRSVVFKPGLTLKEHIQTTKTTTKNSTQPKSKDSKVVSKTNKSAFNK